MPSRLVALMTGATLVTSAVLTTAVVAPAHAKGTDAEVEFVTANLKSDLSVERFQADVSEVLAHRPDFVAYNEVPMRQDSVLAPKGYALYRGTTNRYTKATPVAWRTDRWTAVDTGTFRISNYRKTPTGKRIKLGLRFANWATLRSTDGRQVSIVSMHVAPVFRDDGKTHDLLRGSVSRLGTLMDALPKGPVMVGGDFNVHYRSGRYPRDLFDAASLVPTYDTLGTSFPTGDHGNQATIDYVFNRGAYQLRATEHHPHEVYSDHDSVVGGLTWQVDAPGDTQRVVSDPSGTEDARQAAALEIAQTIRSAPDQGQIELFSTGLSVRSTFTALRAVLSRDVGVHYRTRSKDLTRREKVLRRLIDESGVAGSRFERCRAGCLSAWKASDMSRTLGMLRASSGEAWMRLDSNRTLSEAMLTRRTTVVTQSGQVALDEGEKQLDSVP